MISFFTSKRGFELNNVEDSLTAVVFDNLKHLPTEIFYKIIKRCLFTDKLPVHAGELKSIEFWANWNAESTSNSVKVEPDIFIRFDNLDLIVEAKRKDEKQQYWQQMNNQLTSYCNEYNEDGKDLYYLQLGGLHSLEDSGNHNIKSHGREAVILKGNWSKLLDGCIAETKKLRNADVSLVQPYIRILDDIISGMELHQFYRKKWLDSLTVPEIKTISLKYFYKRNNEH